MKLKVFALIIIILFITLNGCGNNTSVLKNTTEPAETTVAEVSQVTSGDIVKFNNENTKPLKDYFTQQPDNQEVEVITTETSMSDVDKYLKVAEENRVDVWKGNSTPNPVHKVINKMGEYVYVVGKDFIPGYYKVTPVMEGAYVEDYRPSSGELGKLYEYISSDKIKIDYEQTVWLGAKTHVLAKGVIIEGATPPERKPFKSEYSIGEYHVWYDMAPGYYTATTYTVMDVYYEYVGNKIQYNLSAGSTVLIPQTARKVQIMLGNIKDPHGLDLTHNLSNGHVPKKGWYQAEVPPESINDEVDNDKPYYGPGPVTLRGKFIEYAIDRESRMVEFELYDNLNDSKLSSLWVKLNDEDFEGVASGRYDRMTLYYIQGDCIESTLSTPVVHVNRLYSKHFK